MKPLQKAYLEKLHATAAANLQYFQSYLPDLFSLMIRDPMNVSVDVAENGDFQVRFDDGRTFEPGAVRAHVSDELKLFAKPESRRQIIAFQSYLWNQNPRYGRMTAYHYSTLGVDYAFMMGRHYKLHYPTMEGVGKYPDFGSGKLPIMLMFGAGMGYQFEPILQEYEISQLFIIEHDINVFRMSLFFVDYVQLAHHATERNTEIVFVVELDIDKIVQTIGRSVNSKWPHFYIHGAAIFNSLPEDEVAVKIQKMLSDGIWKWYFGWGYFDDELISLKHTIGNFRNQVPVCTKIAKVPEDAVAFIVGSGPSLDQLMPLVRKYKNRAVIFSCGTALSPLAHAGIVPDFQVEKERPATVFDLLSSTQDPEYLKQIRLLGVNLLDPRVPPLFKEAYLLLKMTDAGATHYLDSLRAQFNGYYQFEIQPTVTNTAIVAALNMGFKQIYLLGVDMGFKEAAKHHSKHTAYLKSMPMQQKLRDVLTGIRKERRWAIEGNFGGEVLTNEILDSARDRMEMAIAALPGAKVYNPNDGARIKGAIPIRKPDISIGTTVNKAIKARAIEVITGNFSVPDQYDGDKLIEALIASVNFIREKYSEIASRPMSGKMDVIRAIAEMHRLMLRGDAETRRAQIYVRGTLIQLLLLAYQFATIIRDETEAVAKAQFDFSMIDEFLQEVADLTATLIEQPQAADPAQLESI